INDRDQIQKSPPHRYVRDVGCPHLVRSVDREHKLFAFITMNWRAKPLASYLAIIQLIASTTTKTGLTVACQLDSNAYEKGIKVSDEEMVSLSVKPHSFHGEWNYTIAPRRPDG